MDRGDEAQRTIRRLRDELGRQSTRIDVLETVIWRAWLLCAASALVLGFVLPYLRHDDGDFPHRLLPVMAKVYDETPFAGVLLTLLVLGTVLMLGCLGVLVDYSLEGRALAVVKVLTGLYLVGVVGSWLFVLILGHLAGEEDASGFSPATVALTIGAVLTYTVARTPLAARGTGMPSVY